MNQSGLRKLSFAFAAGCCAVAHANIIVDGSFETPVVGPGQAFGWLPGNSFGGVWDVSGSSYAVLIDNGYQSGGVTWWPTPAGQQYLYVSNAVNLTTVSQDVALSGGTTYNLDWLQADFATPYVLTGGVVNVRVDLFGGGNVATYQASVPAFSTWAANSLQFTASVSGTYVVSFDSEFHHAGLVDDVQLNVVPEPSTLLCLAGLSVFAALRKSRWN